MLNPNPMRFDKNYRFSVFLFVFALFSFKIQAQTVSTVQASVVDGKIEIVYQLTNLKPGQRFQVRLYSSADNYAKHIEKNLTGDIGDNVRAVSVNKIIMADPIGTLGEITGDLNFKVKALLSYNPVTILSPSSTFKQKRKRSAKIVWAGGLKNDQVSIDLYRNDVLLTQNIYTAPNNIETKASFKFPKVKLGEGYTMKLKMTSLDAPVDIPQFKVKRRTSIFGKMVRLSIVAAAADYFGKLGIIFPTEPTAKALGDPPSLGELDEFR